MNCLQCDRPAGTRVAYLDVAVMPNPPRQREPYVKVIAWQCLSVRSHRGELREATNLKQLPRGEF